MGESLQKRFRKSVEPKLIYSPFLRLVLLNFWFQIAFSAIVLVAVFLALYLPKMWRTSPDGFLPIVKISGLDKTQNWSLKRSARKLMAAGNYERAAQSWEVAIAQDPGDQSALRGYLENAANLRTFDKRTYAAALSKMAWLLRLSNTNATDLELVARVCERFKWYDPAIYFLSNSPEELTPRAEVSYLKALFHQNQIPEFERHLARAENRSDDTELADYRLAYKAGWGTGEEASAAMQELERRFQQGNEAATAQLYLRTCARRGNTEGYLNSLRRLVSVNEANAMDHVTYWNLLLAAGRAKEAKALAEAYSSSPASALETIRLAEVYLRLGMIDSSRELLSRFAPEFPHSPEVWFAYATVLAGLKDWEEMRSLALRIRQVQSARDTLWGYSYYLEGLSELEQQRRNTAELAFSRAAESSYDITGMGLLVGRELNRLNYPGYALKVFTAVEKAYDANPEYWDSRFHAALAAQDAAAVLKAAERCYEFNPAELQMQNRYAAALMLNRTSPSDAIQLTLQVVSKYPRNATALINHSFALLLNQRSEEAREILEGIQPEWLKATELASYYLALFETYHNLALWDRAWEAGERIPVESLFPTQRQWLEQKRREMPQRLARTL